MSSWWCGCRCTPFRPDFSAASWTLESSAPSRCGTTLRRCWRQLGRVLGQTPPMSWVRARVRVQVLGLALGLALALVLVLVLVLGLPLPSTPGRKQMDWNK